MADRMSRRERAGSTGILGVIIGATIVIAVAFSLINASSTSTSQGAAPAPAGAPPGLSR